MIVHNYAEMSNKHTRVVLRWIMGHVNVVSEGARATHPLSLCHCQRMDE